MTRLLPVALLCACSANVTMWPSVELDGGTGGTDAAVEPIGTCSLQADCAVGDGVHDICYEYKAMPLTECVDGATLPCGGHEHCGPFGWCDPASGFCAAEGASACLVDWVLTNCALADEVCCEGSDGVHRCAVGCDGEELEP